MAARTTASAAKKATKRKTAVKVVKKTPTRRATPKAKPVKKTTARKAAKAPAPKGAAAPADGQWVEYLSMAMHEVQENLASEIATVKGAVEEALKEGRQALGQADVFTAAGQEDPELERITRSFRRMLGEAMEQRAETFAEPLAAVHARLAALLADGKIPTDGTEEQIRGSIAELASVLTILGVERFEPHPGDVVDPLIHTVVAEESDSGVEAGRVCRVVWPGYHSSRGRVLAPSRVAISRG